MNIDPENHQFLLETNLPTPKNGRVELLIYQRVIYQASNRPPNQSSNFVKITSIGMRTEPLSPLRPATWRRNWCSKRAFRWWFMVNLVNWIVFWRQNFWWAGIVVFLVLSKVAIFLPCQTYLILVILGGHHVMFGNGMPLGPTIPGIQRRQCRRQTQQWGEGISNMGGSNPAICSSRDIKVTGAWIRHDCVSIQGSFIVSDGIVSYAALFLTG